MDTINNWRDALQENLLSVVALVFIGMILVAYAIFTVTGIVPRWTARQNLAAQLLTMQQTVRQTQQQQVSSNEALQAQLAGTQTQLDAAARQFLSETQAAAVLDNLYRYASETGVVIAGLEAQAPPEDTVVKVELYDIRIFALQVTGTVPQLLSFIGRLQETTWPGVALSHINLGENSLAFTLSLYTSPYALGDAAATNIPIPPANSLLPEVALIPSPIVVPLNEVDSLIASLDAPWAIEDWPTVVVLLEQIILLAPDNIEMQTKLYAAYVNYGYRLANEQKINEAQAIFVKALTVFPDGAEALSGLQTVTNPAAATPTPTLHLVTRGETLFLIARQYGITVTDLRTANGLSNDLIYTGQTLLIPR